MELGVALAVPGVIDVLVRGGRFIVEKVDSFQNINKTLDVSVHISPSNYKILSWSRLRANSQFGRRDLFIMLI
jgi:hypothetical protein